MTEKDANKTNQTDENGAPNPETDADDTKNVPEDLEGKIKYFERKKRDADSEALRLRSKLEEEGKTKSEALAKAEEESKKAEALLKEVEEKTAGLTTAEKKAKVLDFENRRLKVALELGLSVDAVDFITGETDDEMKASVERASKAFGAPINYEGARGGLDPSGKKNSSQEAEERVARIYEKRRR